MPYAALLTEEELVAALAALPEWTREGEAITRKVRCDTFREAIELVNAVAAAAEKADHHPDFRIVWRSVTLRLTSKASGGLTQRDVDMAGEIDRLAGASRRAFREAFPILHAHDPDRLVEFYRTAFDFEQGYRFPADGALEYAYLKLPPLGIGIGRRPADAPPAPEQREFELWIYADDVDAAVERAATAGATVLEPAADQPWGERVALVADPAGFRVRIGSATAGDRG